MGNCPSSLRTAIRFHDTDQLKKILEKAGDDSADLINNDYSQDCILQACFRSDGNAVYYTVMMRRSKALAIILQYGADVHSTGYMEETCLHCACRLHHMESVRLLLDHGADLKSTDDRGRYPIHSAAMSRVTTVDGSLIRFLIKDVGKEGDIDVRDFHGRTPLHQACDAGRLASVKALVELGADVNAQTNKGDTPLHLSRSQHAYDYLVENGADTELENKAGEKATRPATSDST